MSGLARKIALNTTVQVVGKVAMTVLSLGATILLTRYLGAEGYGKFTIALVYLSFFGIFADLGLFTIVVREISKDKSKTAEVVGNALSLRALFSVVVMVLAVLLSFLLPYDTDTRAAIAIVSLSVFFGLLNSSLVTVLQARLQMGYSVVADVVGRLATLVAVGVMVAIGAGFYAVVGTAAVGSLVTFLVTRHYVSRVVKVRFLGDRYLWKELLKEAIPLGAALAINQIYFRIDTIILSLLRSPAEVGNYGAAYKVLEILITFPGFFVNSIFPVLSAQEAAGDPKLKRTIQLSFDALWMLSLPVTVAGVVLGPPLMRLVAGAEFTDAGLALQLLIGTVLFNFAVGVFSYPIIIKKRQRLLLVVSSIVLALNVAANFILIPHYGFKAAAITTVVSEAVAFIVLMLIFRRLYHFLPNWRRPLRAIGCALVMAGVAYALQYTVGLPVLVSGGLATLFYGGLLLMTRTVSRAELSQLRRST